MGYAPITMAENAPTSTTTTSDTTPPTGGIGSIQRKVPRPGGDRQRVRAVRNSKGDSEALSPESRRSFNLNEQGAIAVSGRDFHRAEGLFKEALATDPTNLSAAFNLASTYITNKREREAIELLTAYVEKFSGDAGLLARLGDAYFGTQDLNKALECYSKALLIAPNYPNLYSRIGTIHSLRGDLKRAIPMFELSVKQNPRDSQALSNLGTLYLVNGKPRKAIDISKRAIQIRPSKEAYLTLGTAYRQARDPMNALIALQRAQDMGVADPELTKSIADLHEVTKEPH